MSILSQNKTLYGSDVKIITQASNCSVYQFEGETGKGTMTSYAVFPGIELIYNDFKMGNCFSNKNPYTNIMEINHCSQGRFECEFHNGSFIYLKEGDLSVNMLGNHTKNSCFPLEHYVGVSVVIDLEVAKEYTNSLMEDVSIDLFGLRDRICFHDKCFIMRTTPSINHIFSELYTVPDKIKKGYFKLKVLELLLFLSAIDVDDQRREPQYFNKCQVDGVKQIKKYLVAHLDRQFTLAELSNQFDISLTAMKSCFKGVYGTTIFSFVRGYRMQIAAEMLLEGKESVTVIAGKVGYSNASKFAAAFKKEMGVPPMQYKKNCLIGAGSIRLE
ncbi:helix-turn-helix domain-containing protein [Acetobacterium bakii]|uniref:AraC family transcriptional regulator n=1 Tax=Acetobacterium bakii TaxID=52689 RepID=A0A0L6U141_9FIRM|nr:helix-turn-helix domain-containing protein [Acetobacterium bakii]KNZ42224.1 AraC family transcriptional regulator [Acetobacterium bakii]